uniref:Retrovirus-related Pol polyprotein from transposon TNT 1-94-like beta-barrel domain-containing protein n=1 Tax=Cajanus cajan TaxID=3821 RepID=A0A151QQ60_CAJCA|nr:hypothetical protein KK1_046919 [Cajanus cajan]
MTGKHSEWIIDTGASSHMTTNLSLLCGLRDVVGCLVRLPDGKQLMANKEGTVTLDGGLKVETVLYVPTLSCNMLSISQLTLKQIVLSISLTTYVLCSIALRRC